MRSCRSSPLTRCCASERCKRRGRMSRASITPCALKIRHCAKPILTPSSSAWSTSSYLARCGGCGTTGTSMPDPLFDRDDEANTPLTAEEREQLIPSYITLRHELNEAEQINIGGALRWADSRKRDI